MTTLWHLKPHNSPSSRKSVTRQANATWNLCECAFSERMEGKELHVRSALTATQTQNTGKIAVRCTTRCVTEQEASRLEIQNQHRLWEHTVSLPRLLVPREGMKSHTTPTHSLRSGHSTGIRTSTFVTVCYACPYTKQLNRIISTF